MNHEGLALSAGWFDLRAYSCVRSGNLTCGTMKI
jgi:hypothetical protein